MTPRSKHNDIKNHWFCAHLPWQTYLSSPLLEAIALLVVLSPPRRAPLRPLS